MKKVLIPIIILTLVIGMIIIINISKEPTVDNINNDANYIPQKSLNSIVRSKIEVKLNSVGIEMERVNNANRLTLGRGEKYKLTSGDDKDVIEIYEINAEINKMLNGDLVPGEKEIDGEKYWVFERLIIKLTSNTILNNAIKNSLIAY